MKLLRVLALLLISSPVFAACHAVGPTATGAHTGADWNNIETMPGTFVRGDIYYLQDGSYSALTISTAVSGTLTVELRKAQSYDFGSTGCGTSIGAGWNTSTMGSAQAVFSASQPFTIGTSFVTINGNGQQTTAGCGGIPLSFNGSGSQATTPTDCGIRAVTTDTTGSSIVFRLNSGSQNDTFEFIEGVQSGVNNAGSNGMWSEFGSNSGFLVNHVFGRNANCEYFATPAWSHEVKNSYFWYIATSALDSCHPEAYLAGNGSSNTSSTPILDHGNIYRDISGTSTFAINVTSTIWFYVWDDVFFCSTGGCPNSGNDDGIMWCGNDATCTINMYQNSAVNMTVNGNNNDWFFCETTHPCNGNVANNIAYNVINTTGVSGVQNNNTWLNSGAGVAGTGNVTVTSGAANPFVSVANSNFNLAADSSNYNNAATLSAPYNVDAAGNAFLTGTPHSRGAFQFISGSPTAGSPVFTPAAGSYSNPQTITASNPSSAPTGCYTVNGATPATNGTTGCTTGTLYSSSISIAVSETLKMVWGGTGFIDSSPTSAAYVIVAAAPSATLGTGTYVGSQTETYTSATTSATLCMTTTGAAPTAPTAGICGAGSTTLTNGSNFVVNRGENVQVLATLAGATNSSVASFTYTFTPTTWYVLSGGGTRTTCTGQTNAVDPGTGALPRACAFGDLRWLYDNQTSNNWQANGTSWVIAGGDTVLGTSASPIAAVTGLVAASAGPYNRIGWDYGGSCSGAGCGAGYTWCLGAGQCGIPPPPPGTSGSPTHIWGANHGNCSTTTTFPGAFVSTTIPDNTKVFEIYGDFGLNTVMDLSGDTFVDVQCIGITTHGNCVIHASPNPNPCSSSIPLSNYASEGIRSSPTTGTITTTDVWIHGMQDSGWFGPINGSVTQTDTRYSYNVEAGFNMDDGTDPQSGGTVTTTLKVTDFNGCWQVWPFVTTVPIGGCSDQNSSGDGDGTATPGSSFDTFVNDQETSVYNTQDGDDVGHNQAPGSATWTRGIMYGNMGGTFKAGGMSTTMRNSVSIQNCRRMAAAITGTPSGYNALLTGFCRAGDGVGVNWLGGGSSEVIQIQDNAIITYGNDAIDFQIQGTGTCTGCTMVTQSNVFLAYNNPSNGLAHNPVMYGNMSPTTTGSNTIFNFFGYTCIGTDQCVDPLFVGEPPPATNVTDSGLDAFNFNLSSSSPSITSGLVISGITGDFFGTSRLNPTSAGAVQYIASIFTFNTQTVGHTKSVGKWVSH